MNTAYGPDIISQANYEASDLTSVQTGVGTALAQTSATLTYTGDDLIASYMDARNNTVSFAYDGMDRLSTTTYPGGSTEQNQYDPNGNLTIWINRASLGVVRCYDALNRKISERGISGATNAGSCPTGGTENSGAYHFADRAFGYDLVNRLTSASAGSGWTGTWVYDAWNNLDSFSTLNNGAFSEVYDLAGNLTQLTGPGGYVAGYGYDAMNRMISATYTPSGGAALTVASLAYDSLGRRSSVAYGDSSTATYGWDTADRLTSLAHAFPSSGSNVTFGYSYDPAFRALTRTISNGAYAYGAAPGTSSYGTANALNQYPSVGGQTFTWSAQGPLQTDQAQTYGYDELNHLAYADRTAAPANAVSSPADARGLTYSRQTGGQATNVLTYFTGIGQGAANAVERVYANTGSGWTLQGDRRLVQGPGADEFLAYVDVSGAVYYPHVDETGTAIALSQGTGAPTVLNYDPFGVSANPILDQPTGAATYAYRYTGQRLDPLSGVYDYKARAYEPGIGRFLQTDPAGLSASPNLYAYVGNNPVNRTDSSGLDPCVPETAIGYSCDGIIVIPPASRCCVTNANLLGATQAAGGGQPGGGSGNEGGGSGTQNGQPPDNKSNCKRVMAVAENLDNASKVAGAAAAAAGAAGLVMEGASLGAGTPVAAGVEAFAFTAETASLGLGIVNTILKVGATGNIISVASFVVPQIILNTSGLSAISSIGKLAQSLLGVAYDNSLGNSAPTSECK